MLMERTVATTTSYREGARRAVPLAIAVGGFGITYGVLARQAGFTIPATILFSVLAFAGSAQFAAVSIVSDGGTAAAAIVAALLLNARYLPIGLSVAPWLPGRPAVRALQGQVTVDESWAVSHTGGGRYDPRLLVGAGATLWASWVVCCVGGRRGRLGARRTPRPTGSTPRSRRCSSRCSPARSGSAGCCSPRWRARRSRSSWCPWSRPACRSSRRRSSASSGVLR